MWSVWEPHLWEVCYKVLSVQIFGNSKTKKIFYKQRKEVIPGEIVWEWEKPSRAGE